jgi:hypothetical protein
MRSSQIRSVAACIGALCAGAQAAAASSHREAPAIAEDQYADNTDLYAFISPDSADHLVVVANYVPLLIPSSGPNFYRFSDDAAYDVHIDNDGDAKRDLTYRFLFKTSVANGDTFLYNTGAITSLDDATLNVRQSYDVIRIDHAEDDWDVIAANVPVAPWNVGKRSFPDESYEGVALTAVSDDGERKFFAGPRDEPFFVDLHVFDLLGVGGAPTTDGVNVMSIVMQVPITDVARDGTRPAAGTADGTSVVGIYATASRQRTRILRREGDQRTRGDFVQVSRLGWPLVNEVVIPLKDKDNFNRSKPHQDVDNFGAYILFPELPGLLNAVLGAGCADTPADGRLDIAGLLSPSGTVIADLLRIDITEGQTAESSQFPNGRALADDVTDTLLTVVCNTGGPLGDGVDGNDKPFSDTFPYVASPHSGNP